jgi:hypothetical protein
MTSWTLLQTHGGFVVALALWLVGVGLAIAAADWMKRVAGLVLGFLAAAMFAAQAGFAWDGGEGAGRLALALVVCGLGFGAVGLVLTILARERYGLIDAASLAAADDAEDTADRDA